MYCYSVWIADKQGKNTPVLERERDWVGEFWVSILMDACEA